MLVRNPYFREWSHAARPDGYPDRIVFRLIGSQTAELAAIERGSRRRRKRRTARQTACPSCKRGSPASCTSIPLSPPSALILNTRTAPFNDVRVRRAINYAIDRAKVARLLGKLPPAHLPDTAPLPPRLPTLLPLHDRPQRGRGLARTQPRAGRTPDRRLAHARDAGSRSGTSAPSSPATRRSDRTWSRSLTSSATRPRSRTSATTSTPRRDSPTPGRAHRPPSVESGRATCPPRR